MVLDCTAGRLVSTFVSAARYTDRSRLALTCKEAILCASSADFLSSCSFCLVKADNRYLHQEVNN